MAGISDRRDRGEGRERGKREGREGESERELARDGEGERGESEREQRSSSDKTL